MYNIEKITRTEQNVGLIKSSTIGNLIWMDRFKTIKFNIKITKADMMYPIKNPSIPYVGLETKKYVQ